MGLSAISACGNMQDLCLCVCEFGGKGRGMRVQANTSLFKLDLFLRSSDIENTPTTPLCSSNATGENNYKVHNNHRGITEAD